MPGRPRKITYKKRYDGGSYWLTFYDHKNRRQRVNTKLKDEDLVKLLKQRITKLQNLSLSPHDDSLVGYNYEAFKLYYQEDATHTAPITDDSEKIVVEIFEGKDEIEAPLSAAKEIDRLRRELAKKDKELHKYKTLWLSYENTREAKLIKAYKNSPTLKEAFKQYKLRNLSKLYKEGQEHKVTIGRLVKFFPKETRVIEPTVSQLLDFLDFWITPDPKDPRTNYKQPKKRYNVLRKHLVKFYNWLDKVYDIPSPMSKIESIKKVEISEIQFFDYEYLENLIGNLDLYWKAVTATMAYAGLRRSELLGLRLIDFYEEENHWYVNIFEHEERTLKNERTARTIQVSSSRLLPILIEYMSAKLHGEKYLFPSLAETKQEIWNGSTFDEYFRGHEGGKRKNKREGVVPKEVTCRSLRRSFNQNKLRDGMSREALASYSGHDIATNAEFYARLEPKEINIG